MMSHHLWSILLDINEKDRKTVLSLQHYLSQFEIYVLLRASRWDFGGSCPVLIPVFFSQSLIRKMGQMVELGEGICKCEKWIRNLYDFDIRNE